jgi:hypothetical protein
LIYQGVPERFPRFRWSFVETTSSGFLTVSDLVIRTQAERKFPYVFEYAGDDNLVAEELRPRYSKDIEAIPNTRARRQDQSIACAKDFG